MQPLREMEIGLMFWGEDDPLASLRELKSLGLRCGHLGVAGGISLEGAAEKWKTALDQEQFSVTSVVASFNGESYADIPTVQKTVGYIPQGTRKEREERTYKLIDFAAALGAPSYCCHAGHVPEDFSGPLYPPVRDIVRRICDYAARQDVLFVLETGQESPQVLEDFIKDVDRPNLKVNFDPANIILYGVCDPIDALSQLAPWVASVHCKDGIWPPKDKPGSLGTEKRLGDGQVGIDRFIAKLKEIGYTGPLTIEREVAAASQEDRHVAGLPHREDVQAAISLLERLRD